MTTLKIPQLTADLIREAQPGSKLDDLVAHYIFGWKPWHFDNPSRIPGEIAFSFEALVPPEYDGSKHLDMDIPPYSTRIEAAWLVWEWLEANPPQNAQPSLSRHLGEPTISMTTYDSHEGQWPRSDNPKLLFSGKVTVIENVMPRYFTGTSYPHAICLAALWAAAQKAAR